MKPTNELEAAIKKAERGIYTEVSVPAVISCPSASMKTTFITMDQPEIWKCSPMLRWVKRGSKHMLQQLWADIYSAKQEWRDVPLAVAE